MSNLEIRNFSNMPELHFGEGSDLLIRKGLKLASTRIPDAQCDFSRGEEMVAVCGINNTPVPVVISDISDARLIDFSIPRLSLGGFLTHNEAASRLTGFFQTPIEETSVMRHMVFFDSEKFQNFSDEQRQILLTLPTDDAIKHRELRAVFFPSILHWSMVRNEIGAREGMRFLNEHGLITPAEYDILRGWSGDLPTDAIELSNLFSSLLK